MWPVKILIRLGECGQADLNSEDLNLRLAHIPESRLSDVSGEMFYSSV